MYNADATPAVDRCVLAGGGIGVAFLASNLRSKRSEIAVSRTVLRRSTPSQGLFLAYPVCCQSTKASPRWLRQGSAVLFFVFIIGIFDGQKPAVATEWLIPHSEPSVFAAKARSANIVVPVGICDPTHYVETPTEDSVHPEGSAFFAHWPDALKNDGSGFSRQESATDDLEIIVAAFVWAPHGQSILGPEHKAVSIENIGSISPNIRNEKLPAYQLALLKYWRPAPSIHGLGRVYDDISHTQPRPMPRNHILPCEADGFVGNPQHTASGPPEGKCGDKEKCSEKGDVSIRLIKSMSPPIQDGMNDRSDRAHKNAAIFFCGLIGGTCLFYFATKCKP